MRSFEIFDDLPQSIVIYQPESKTLGIAIKKSGFGRLETPLINQFQASEEVACVLSPLRRKLANRNTSSMDIVHKQILTLSAKVNTKQIVFNNIYAECSEFKKCTLSKDVEILIIWRLKTFY